MPRVSAALIVRDESKFITGCLQSLVDTVDEVVVVDTGSRDDTIDKAKRFPIQLRHFRWCNDFSAARNFAIEQASGDWILYIDADERFEVRDPRVLSRVLGDDGRLAWRLRLQPRVGWTAYSELRLFRNDPRIRFRGVIHERLEMDAVVRADAPEVGACDLTLHHVGYEGDQSHKNARNIPLLRAYLERERDRVYCWWHLGESLRLAGDEEGALDAWSQGASVTRERERSTLALGDSLPLFSLIKLQHDRGMRVDDLLGEALALFPRHLALQWIAAKLAIERGDLHSARPVLEGLAAVDADTFFDPDLAYDKALFRHQAQEALALCHFRAGQFKEAARHYRLAAAAVSDPREYALKARLAEMRAAV